jgi:hypothetical protein
MPSIHPIEHRSVHAPSHPVLGMLLHPRATMSGLLQYHPGDHVSLIGAVAGIISVLAVAMSVGRGAAPLELLVLMGAFFGIFFVHVTSWLVQTVSDRFFGGAASGSEVRTALSWSLIPMSVVNLVVWAFALTPMFSLPLAVLAMVGGLVWTAIVMDHALGDAEAYGDGPAMLVLVFVMVCLIGAIVLAYLPLWYLTPMIETYLWYGSF